MSDEQNKEMQLCFIEEAKELLENSEQCFLSLEHSDHRPKLLEQIFRLAHNLKGSAKAVGFESLGDFTHDLETFLLALKQNELTLCAKVISLLLQCNDHLKKSIDKLQIDPKFVSHNPGLQGQLKSLREERKSKPTEIPGFVEWDAPASTSLPEESVDHRSFLNSPTKNKVIADSVVKSSDESIRVNLNKIEELLNGVGELAIYQTVMAQHKYDMANQLGRKTIDQMTKIIRDVQNLSMSLRMIPLKQTFQKMQRIVRDTSRTLSKEVQLVLTGEETEIDKTVLEKLSDPLVHLIRNALDHGLESSEERVLHNKNSIGKVTLSAYQHAGSLIIEISDDGKGIDTEVIRKKAIASGLISSTDSLTEYELQQLIFAPGFSTKSEVTDVSGRGVGMNVVKTNIVQLQGNIEIQSKVGQGTCFRILLPLTMAIFEGVVVRLGEERFVIPLSQITEFFRITKEHITHVAEASEVLTIRKENLAVYRLAKLLKKRTAFRDASEHTALIVKDSTEEMFAVLVDEVISLQQIVIKPLGLELQNHEKFKGAAILGDGRPALIVDLVELTTHLRTKLSNQKTVTNYKEAL